MPPGRHRFRVGALKEEVGAGLCRRTAPARRRRMETDPGKLSRSLHAAGLDQLVVELVLPCCRQKSWRTRTHRCSIMM